MSDGMEHVSGLVVPSPGMRADVPESRPLVVAPTSRRILIVDDNEPAAKATSELLKLDGHKVATVHDGLAALEAIRAIRPEIVILDVGLPGIDGFEVAHRVRGEFPASKPLIVGVSGHGDDRSVRRSREAGFDHYLVKPVDCDRLLALIAGHRPGDDRTL